MPPSRKRERRPIPPASEQVALRAMLEELVPVLTARAAKLASGLRPPRPTPEDLVNDTMAKMLRVYRDTDVESARKLAFTVLARVVCDIARRYKFDAGLIEDDSIVEAESAPPPPDVSLPDLLSRLEPREACVVNKVILSDVAVPRAFKECGWDTKSPYYAYNNLLAKLRDAIAETSP